jgi:hypothetical protein
LLRLAWLDEIDEYVVPLEVLDVAQVQEAQPEAPVALVVRQPHQSVCDDAVFRIQLGLVAVARLADAKRPARQINRG